MHASWRADSSDMSPKVWWAAAVSSELKQPLREEEGGAKTQELMKQERLRYLPQGQRKSKPPLRRGFTASSAEPQGCPLSEPPWPMGQCFSGVASGDSPAPL